MASDSAVPASRSIPFSTVSRSEPEAALNCLVTSFSCKNGAVGGMRQCGTKRGIRKLDFAYALLLLRHTGGLDRRRLFSQHQGAECPLGPGFYGLANGILGRTDLLAVNVEDIEFDFYAVASL